MQNHSERVNYVNTLSEKLIDEEHPSEATIRAHITVFHSTHNLNSIRNVSTINLGIECILG